MTQFHRKTAIIEAFQLPAIDEDAGPFMEWAALVEFDGYTSEREGCMAIETLQGTVTAEPGDWIIKDADGQFYPCKPGTFSTTYESADAPIDISRAPNVPVPAPDTTFYAGWVGDKVKYHSVDQLCEYANARVAAALAAVPSVPDTNFVTLEGLRDKLLAARKIARDKDGWLVHPDFPLCDEDVRADKLLEAFGIESSFVSMDGDADQALVDRYFEDGDANCSDWTPTAPEGDGWMLLEIYDTEDGPYALFARRKVEETNRQRRARENAEAAAATTQSDSAWRAGEPPTKTGDYAEYIVAVRRKHASEKVFVFSANYANEYIDDNEDEEQKPRTGWYMQAMDMSGEFSYVYEKLLNEGDEVIGWQALPKWSDAPAQSGDPLTCDFCGAATLDPWHTSSATEKHLHQCDVCHAAPSQSCEPVLSNELHHDTAKLVRRFARALGNKLFAAQRKYGYSNEWAEADWMDRCREDLIRHVRKGDPRDVAAYCAFLWHHDQSTTPAANLPDLKLSDELLDERIKAAEQATGIYWFVPDDSERYLWRTINTDQQRKFAHALLASNKPAVVQLRCPACRAPRSGDSCHKCGSALVEPCEGWEEPRLPPIERIRELAREVGYAIGVHGTLERDLDLIAAPWSDEALRRNYREVMQYIADGLGARLVEVEAKPLGRRACTIQMDGWYKPIDLSVANFLPPSAPQEQTAAALTVQLDAAYAALDAVTDWAKQEGAADETEAGARLLALLLKHGVHPRTSLVTQTETVGDL